MRTGQHIGIVYGTIGTLGARKRQRRPVIVLRVLDANAAKDLEGLNG